MKRRAAVLHIDQNVEKWLLWVDKDLFFIFILIFIKKNTFLTEDPMNTHGDGTVLAACLSKPGRIKLWHLFLVSALLIFEEVVKVGKVLNTRY